MITAAHVKPGATVIDVGVSRTEAGIVGDVDFEPVSADRRGDHADARRHRPDDHRLPAAEHPRGGAYAGGVPDLMAPILMSSVQSVERAFAVLRCLSGGPAGVTDVADRVNLPKSTVSRMLSTLEDLGMVEQIEPGGNYRVGAGMVEIAAAVLPGRSLIAAVRPHLHELVKSHG